MPNHTFDLTGQVRDDCCQSVELFRNAISISCPSGTMLTFCEVRLALIWRNRVIMQMHNPPHVVVITSPGVFGRAFFFSPRNFIRAMAVARALYLPQQRSLDKYRRAALQRHPRCHAHRDHVDRARQESRAQHRRLLAWPSVRGTR